MEWRLLKYVAREFFPVFLFSNLMILFVLIMFQMLQLSDLVIGHGASIWEAMLLLIVLMMSFLPASFPISCLMSSNMVMGRMSFESELIALVSAGVPVRVILKQFFIVALVVTAVSQWLSISGVPWANRRLNDLLLELGARNFAVTIKPGVFIENFHGMLLYAEHVDSGTENLRNVFVYDERDPRLPMVVLGKSVSTHQTGKEKLQINFGDGEIHVNRANGSYQKILFDSYDLAIPINVSYDKGGPVTMGLSQRDLLKKIREAKNDPRPEEKEPPYLMLELYRRFSLPYACLIFIILGALWGTGHFRSMQGRPILVSLVITVGYWCVFLLGDNMGRNRVIPSWLGVWLPNFILLAMVLILWRSRRRYV